MYQSCQIPRATYHIEASGPSCQQRNGIALQENHFYLVRLLLLCQKGAEISAFLPCIAL